MVVAEVVLSRSHGLVRVVELRIVPSGVRDRMG